MSNVFRDAIHALVIHGEVRIRLHRKKWVVVVESPHEGDLDGMPRAFGEGTDVLDALEACLRNLRRAP